MVTTGARAARLQLLFEQIGFESVSAAGFGPSVESLSVESLQHIQDLYLTLGGTQPSPRFRPGSWDLVFRGGVLVELDEELHFNRYRRLTLEPDWTGRFPWRDDYLTFTTEYEPQCLSAGRWGKRWTNESCERLFGAADPPGVFAASGAPRWKQRALYDAIKDAVALSAPDIELVRLATVDVVDGVRLGDLLEGDAEVELGALKRLVEGRSGGRRARLHASPASSDRRTKGGLPVLTRVRDARGDATEGMSHDGWVAGSSGMSNELAGLIASAAPPGSTIYTLTQSKPNWIVDVGLAGIVVETEASRAKGSNPQLIPGWMFQVAWDELDHQKRLSQTDLLNRLNVKRSAAVIAILARVPGITTESVNPTVLLRE